MSNIFPSLPSSVHLPVSRLRRRLYRPPLPGQWAVMNGCYAVTVLINKGLNRIMDCDCTAVSGRGKEKKREKKKTPARGFCDELAKWLITWGIGIMKIIILQPLDRKVESQFEYLTTETCSQLWRLWHNMLHNMCLVTHTPHFLFMYVCI